MFRKLWILSLLLVIGLGQAVARPAEKLTTILRVNSITGRLLEVATSRVAHGGDTDRSSLNKEVDRLLQQERDPDVLARVALISHIYLSPGSAGDERFDDVFDVAWEACIRRIEQIGGQSAIDALESIERDMRLDGAYSLLWKTSMERLKSKQTTNGVK
jgi:hypothetical protein